MKLRLLFIAMDLITILAYPIVFLHGWLHQFLKPRAGIAGFNLLVTDPSL